MEAIVTGFAANVLSSVVVKVGTLLAKKTNQVVNFDAADELKELLTKTRLLFGNLKTTETWQCETADVFGVFYDIEDLVDDLMVNASNSSVLQKIKKPFKGKSRSTRKKIQEVRERLQKIISLLELGNKTQQQQQQLHQSHAKKVPVAVSVSSDKLFGRKEEKEEIIRLLLDDTIRSVSIVGIGGLGKTTLASNIRDDTRIQEKFNHNIRWVPVSAEFDLKAVAKSILKSHLENGSDEIRGSFEKLCDGKSVLIVLDGLQDVTVKEWQSFSSLFLPASAGCKVLITTHNPRVVLTTGATPYHLPLMKDSECQALIIDRARNVNCLSGRPLTILEHNAEAIAKMSKGLPMAASILGQYLSSKCRANGFITLSNEQIYHTREYKEEIFPALKLSTADMRSDLKRCLGYCSLFPRNHDFKKDSLVELWIAEGFFPPQEERSLMEIGKDYFDDLYCRSFFQPSQLGEHETSTQSSYKMHEFIHRFAELVASATGICFRLEDINDFSSNCWYEKARHLSLLCTSVQLDLEIITKCNSLRTFLLPSEHGMRVGQIPYSFFEKLGRLRVLDLSRTDVIEIPRSIGRLKLLQYLNLSETCISMLPVSISKLVGLQVLKLRGCTKLLQLPTELYTLTSLVHLDVDMQRLLCIPANIGSLIHLQTLPKFFVGDKEGCYITELKNLKSLHGTLSLFGLENVKDRAEAREAKLYEKQSLTRLEFEWSSHFTDEAQALDVFEGLAPYNNVKELKVTCYIGSIFPAWITSRSCTLESIEVENCSLDDVLPTLGQLSFLKILHLECMDRVTHMSCGAFPLLKSLEIKNMKNLTHWHKFPDNCMPELNKLTITDCPSLSYMQSLKFMKSLQTLEINCCPVLEALPQLPPSVQSLIIFDSDMVDPEWYRIKSIPSVEINNQKVTFP